MVALSRELTAQKLGYLGFQVPGAFGVWSELGPEKAQGGGTRVAVWLGRSDPGGGRGVLGLGRAEEHLDLRVEVDLLGKRENTFAWKIAVCGEWSIRCRVVYWHWEFGPAAGQPVLGLSIYSAGAQCQSGAALGNAKICALSNCRACTVAALKATRTGLPTFVVL